MSGSRDEFSREIVRILRERCGGKCSNPDCRRPTTGPNSDPDKATRIGVAAHITAAARGGPRYDSSLSSDQRSSIQNGIWLCQTCGKLIDSDQQFYQTGLLYDWRHQAETAARHELEAGKIRAVSSDSREIILKLDQYTTLKKIPIQRARKIFFIAVSACLLPLVFLYLKFMEGDLQEVKVLLCAFLIGSLIALLMYGTYTDEILAIIRGIKNNGVAKRLRNERWAEISGDAYIIFLRRGQCQYRGCTGVIAITDPPMRHRHEQRSWAICLRAGRQHSHAIDFNWVIEPKEADWRPIQSEQA